MKSILVLAIFKDDHSLWLNLLLQKSKFPVQFRTSSVFSGILVALVHHVLEREPVSLDHAFLLEPVGLVALLALPV